MYMTGSHLLSFKQSHSLLCENVYTRSSHISWMTIHQLATTYKTVRIRTGRSGQHNKHVQICIHVYGMKYIQLTTEQTQTAMGAALHRHSWLCLIHSHSITLLYGPPNCLNCHYLSNIHPRCSFGFFHKVQKWPKG